MKRSNKRNRKSRDRDDDDDKMPSDKKFFQSFLNIMSDSGRSGGRTDHGEDTSAEPLASPSSMVSPSSTNVTTTDDVEVATPLPSIPSQPSEQDAAHAATADIANDSDYTPSHEIVSRTFEIVSHEVVVVAEDDNDDDEPLLSPSSTNVSTDAAVESLRSDDSASGSQILFDGGGSDTGDDPFSNPLIPNISLDVAVAPLSPIPSQPIEDGGAIETFQDDLDTDAIVEDMSIEDLRDLTKRILRLAKQNNDNTILSEIKDLIVDRQQHQRQNGNTKTVQDDIAVPETMDDKPDEIVKEIADVSDSAEPVPTKEVKEKAAVDDKSTENVQEDPVVINSPTQNAEEEADVSDSVNDVIAENVPEDVGASELVDDSPTENVQEVSDKEEHAIAEIVDNVPTGNSGEEIIESSDAKDNAATKSAEPVDHAATENIHEKAEADVSTHSGRAGPDLSNPDSIFSLPPLHRNSRSHDSDMSDAAKPISRRKSAELDASLVMSPTLRTSNKALRLNLSDDSEANDGVKNDATTSSNNNDDQSPLKKFIAGTSEPTSTRFGGSSLGEPSLPSLRHKTTDMTTSSPPRSRSRSPVNLDGTSSSLGSSTNNSSGSMNNISNSYRSGSLSLHMSNESLNVSHKTDASYSHLEGMNQPKMNGSDQSNEMSLGDDVRMIFDIENERVADTPEVVEESDESQVPTITEEEDESNAAPKPVDLSTIPTIAEEEEEEEDEDEEKIGQSLNKPELDQEEDLQKSSVSMTVLPSGAIVKRETVMLKPRARAEPPGAVAVKDNNSSRFLSQARSTHRSPPASPQKLPSKPAESKPKKIMNPYYALSYYSGGKGNDISQESNDPEEESTPEPNNDALDPPGEDGESLHMSTHNREEEALDPPGEDGDSISKPKQDSDEGLKREPLHWEKKFMGIGACYLVFHSDEDELNIHYSESPMADAVGVWTSPDISNFKESQGLSECELIGTCASHVTQDDKNFCQGWCQFIKAAKIMDGTVTAVDSVGLAVEFYLYDKGRTIQVSSGDGETVFDTQVIDAIACVPKGCDFPATGIAGKKWGKIAKKLGAVALFKSLSTKKSKEVDSGSLGSKNTNDSKMVREVPVSVPIPVRDPRDESLSTLNTFDVVTPMAAAQKSLSAIIDWDKSPPLSAKKTTSSAVKSESNEPPSADEGACYLVYDPDSSGQLVEHYSKTWIDFAIGRWIPGTGKKIANFKFKRNLGRNALIQNCSGGVQGRKNFYSGWCQFVRSAKNMKGFVTLWDTVDGRKGLKVDVCLYMDDSRVTHQTVRMEEGVPYDTDKIIAVACLPKGTPFFDNMKSDLILWLAEGSKHGYSSKM